jgi:hypothetical protein
MGLLPLVLIGFQLASSLEQWRVVHRSGSVEAGWGIPRQETIADVRSAWAWSARTVPRRAEASRLGRERRPDDPGRLAVRVVRRAAGLAARAPRDLRVLAAPAEMWREVPEAALPSWPVPRDGRLELPLDAGRPWRLRVAGAGEGSWWVELRPGERAAQLTSAPARGIEVAVLDTAGKPAAGVTATVQEAAPRGGTLRSWAVLRGDDGRLGAPGLTDEAEVSLTLIHAGSPPLLLRGRPSALPREVRLAAGAELAGRLVDERGQPVAGAAVAGEFFVSSELPQLSVVKSRSGSKGEWRLRGLPAGQVAWSASAPGRVPLAETTEVEAAARQDLGVRVLAPGGAIEVAVVDDGDAPVAGARIEGGPKTNAATTDAAGIARLSGLPAAPLELRGSAAAHLPASVRLNPPLPPRARVVLPRAFVLAGRLVDASGTAVAQGMARVDARNCQRQEALRDGGRFRIDLPPASDAAELILRSPSTRELRLRIAPGTAGEVRDLGDLAAPAGLAITGRVVRADDGLPLAGARIWSTRQGPEGPAVAWAARDLLEAAAGEDGRFQLSGVAPAPIVLRVEAAGLARRQLALQLSDQDGDTGSSGTVDVGTIALGTGATLHVRVQSRGEELSGAVARADLGNRWLEPDMLAAQVWNGEAMLTGVPAGQVTVSVLAGRRLVCERRVEVPDGGDLDVDCRHSALTVAGVVTVGGAPAGGGMLAWQMPQGEVPGRIDTVESASGLRQQQIVGAGRPQVSVAVAADGRFETDELTAGRWQVLWFFEGAASSPVSLDVPDGERFETVIKFPGLAVSGTVSDRDGKPVEGARVRELIGGALAFSRPDGSFSLAGLKPGKAAVQAQRMDETSEVSEIELGGETAAAPLHLVLGERKGPTVTITVVDAAGAPAAGAYVFFEEAGKGQRLVVADAAGKAAVTLEAPLAPQVRAAAFAGGAWGLGGWASSDAAKEGLAVALAGAASLTVTSSTLSGSPRVVSEDGWEVSWLLRQLGAPPAVSPQQPMQVNGLASGRYTVSLAGRSVGVTVAPEHPGEGRLD